MAVKIRMKRVGRTNRPEFRIVVADARAPRDGEVIENLGFYHPLEKDAAKVVRIDEERAKYWLSVGAQPSETVTSILKRRGIAIPWLLREQERKKEAAAARRAKKGKPPRAERKPRPAKPQPTPEEKAARAAKRAAKREAKKAK